jgi:twitching motility two-component system response regulator PilG
MQGDTGRTMIEADQDRTDGAVADRAYRVMVVDDSKTIRRTAETLLRKEGFEVVTAIDGFEALGKIIDYQPDLIFLDIMMPRLDGYQTCALIKRHRIFRDTPVVMLSSRDGLFDRARGRVAGSDRHIAKPFTQKDLLAVITDYGGNRG